MTTLSVCVWLSSGPCGSGSNFLRLKLSARSESSRCSLNPYRFGAPSSSQFLFLNHHNHLRMHCFFTPRVFRSEFQMFTHPFHRETGVFVCLQSERGARSSCPRVPVWFCDSACLSMCAHPWRRHEESPKTVIFFQISHEMLEMLVIGKIKIINFESMYFPFVSLLKAF